MNSTNLQTEDVDLLSVYWDSINCYNYINLTIYGYSPCRWNLDHNFRSFKTDLRGVSFLILNLSRVNHNLHTHTHTISFNNCTAHTVMKICQYKSCLARPVIIINHFTVKLMPSGRLRAPVIRLFITVRSRFQPKTQIKHFPQFLKRGREATACSCVCNGEGVSYQTGSGLLLLIAQVYPQFDSTDGDSPLKTHTRPKVTVTLTTHGKDRNSVMETPLWLFRNHFPVAGGLFQILSIQTFILAFMWTLLTVNQQDYSGISRLL